MNFAAFERAQVAAFAYREARHTGSLDCMRAVIFVLRNRVKSSWADGSWLGVMEMAHLTASRSWSPGAELAPSIEPGSRVSSDRLLQMIVRDVDDIYLGQESLEDAVRAVVSPESRVPSSAGSQLGTSNSGLHGAKYYNFVDQQVRPWFLENIIRNHAEHAQMGQIGTMMLYR
jgi:hypothetical protein